MAVSVDPESIREQLAKIDGLLTENEARFFRGICERAIDPKTQPGAFKEIALGLELFPERYSEGRDAGYVRKLAGRLRQKLICYYAEHPDDTVQIRLHPGSYEPQFSTSSRTVARSLPTYVNSWHSALTAALLLVAVTSGILLLFIVRIGAGMPRQADFAQAEDSPVYNRGVTRMNLRHYVDAIADFNEVLNTMPADTRALYNRAICNMNLKRWREAVRDFNSIGRGDPNYIRAVRNRAICEMNLQNFGGADADLTRSLNRRP